MAPNTQARPRRRSWHNVAMTALLLLLGGPLSAATPDEDVVTGPQQPPITIVLKGGAGVIKVDRTWRDGANLCWESRGVRNCTPRKLVSYIRNDGLAQFGEQHDANLPHVESASLLRRGSSLHFVGQVRNGPGKRWSGLTLVIRFFDSQNNFKGQDTVALLPSNLDPNDVATFDHSVLGDTAQLYRQSEPSRGAFKRSYSFLANP